MYRIMYLFCLLFISNNTYASNQNILDLSRPVMRATFNHHVKPSSKEEYVGPDEFTPFRFTIGDSTYSALCNTLDLKDFRRCLGGHNMIELVSNHADEGLAFFLKYRASDDTMKIVVKLLEK